MSDTSLSDWLTLETLADSAFWRILAEQFRTLDLDGDLSAELDVVRSGEPCCAWRLPPLEYTTARIQFERLAQYAAAKLQRTEDPHNKLAGSFISSLVGVWLDTVWSCLLLSRDFLKRRQEDGGEYAWTITHLCEASAVICTLLENKAFEAELKRQGNGAQAEDANDDAGSIPARNPFATKEQREWAIKSAAAAQAGGSKTAVANWIGVDYRDLRAWARDRGVRLAKGRSTKVDAIERNLLTYASVV
jgi:hypothetical protein